MLLGILLVAAPALADVSEFEISAARATAPGQVEVTVKANFPADSPEGRYVRVSVLDSNGWVLDSQKLEWSSGRTETRKASFTGLPYVWGARYAIQADAYCPLYGHHFQRVSLWATGDIRVFVDGRQIELDTAPVIVGGRVLVPARGVFEALGATVTYDEATREVTITRGDTVVVLPLGAGYAFKNRARVNLDVAAQVMEGRTMVPLRFVSEMMGVKTTWDARAHAVYLSTRELIVDWTYAPEEGGTP
jgi:hypothetical protein